MRNHAHVIARASAALLPTLLLLLMVSCSDPTPTPVLSIEELETIDDVTVGDITAALSEGEVSCARNTIGRDVFDEIQNIPIASVPAGTADLLFECLTPEHAVGINVAIMSADAGGLNAETRGCIRDIALVDPAALGIGEPPAADPARLAEPTLRIHLCLSDEEATTLSASRGVDLPLPSAIVCMQEYLGGPDALVAIFSAEESDTEAALNLFGAAIACEPAAQG